MVCCLNGVCRLSLIPKVTITSQDAYKISDETGHRQCKCLFHVDSDVYKWEVRVLKGDLEPELGAGNLIESGNFLKHDKSQEIVVEDTELSNGDGVYTISIYAQGLNGYWSNGTYSKVYVGFNYNKKRNYNYRWKYNCKTYR